MAEEKRPDERQRRRPLRYTIVVLKEGKLKFIDLTGRIVETSKNGLCFVTHYPLKSGCVVEFKNKVRQCSHGVVMWIKNLGGTYMAGARLIQKGRSSGDSDSL